MPITKLRVIPMPKEVLGEDIDGNFAIINTMPKIKTNVENWQPAVNSFIEYALKVHSLEFENTDGAIELLYDETLENGEYRVETFDGIKLYASGIDGAGYSLATLLQIIVNDNNLVAIPMVTINDKPDCEFRTLMIDLARQWHDFEHILQYIDLCFLYKTKYLHLHFIDTQSYTLPCDTFPDVPTAGRHYTKEQIACLNDYSKKRNIELIPEIEIPGHGAAMINAYPELFANSLMEQNCDDADPTAFKTEFKNNIICVGKPDLFKNLDKMIVEILEMFPNSKYLHIGGDEAQINEWSYCVDCRRYMEENNISNVRALYTRFTKIVTDMVLAHGRTPIVWEGFPKEGAAEISKDVMVIAWESYYHFATDLIEEGFNIINASWQPLYIVPGRHWSVEEILAWNIYNWQHWWPKSEAHLNPIHLQPTNQVIGAQLCAWECTYEQEIEPVKENLAALMERTWNIRRYQENEQFREKLDYIIEIATKIIER